MKNLIATLSFLFICSQIVFSQSQELRDALGQDDVASFIAAADMDAVNNCFDVKGGMSNFLCLAIKVEAPTITQYLIENNADVNLTCQGVTPLMFSAKYGQLASLKALIEAGADLNTKYEGKSVYDYASKHNEILDFLATIEN